MNPSKPRRPVCPALIICEHVAVDTENGRIDIHNLINAIMLETIPAELRFAVHFSLTEGSLRTPMVVHKQPVFIQLTLRAIGQCWLKLYANGELIAQRWLSIMRRVGN